MGRLRCAEVGRLRCAEVGRLRCAEVGRDLWADELLSREALRDRSGVTASMKRDATCFTAGRFLVEPATETEDVPGLGRDGMAPGANTEKSSSSSSSVSTAGAIFAPPLRSPLSDDKS